MLTTVVMIMAMAMAGMKENLAEGVVIRPANTPEVVRLVPGATQRVCAHPAVFRTHSPTNNDIATTTTITTTTTTTTTTISSIIIIIAIIIMILLLIIIVIIIASAPSLSPSSSSQL